MAWPRTRGAHPTARILPQAPLARGDILIAPVFGSAVYLYGGWPFVAGAWRELKSRLPG